MSHDVYAERLALLTDPEREVWQHTREGKNTKAIAAIMDCARSTVKIHRKRARRKLGAMADMKL